VNGFTITGCEPVHPWVEPTRIGQWEGHLTTIDTETRQAAQSTVRSYCPDCRGRLTVLRIISGRAGSEYWTLRCTRCGGIHLDIIRAVAELPEPA